MDDGDWEVRLSLGMCVCGLWAVRRLAGEWLVEVRIRLADTMSVAFGSVFGL